MALQEQELKRKIILMMTFRMVIIITLLGSAILIQLVSRTILPINPLYFLIFLTCFFTLIYGFSFPHVSNLRVMAYFQLTGDILVITLLLYFTGGVHSSFSFLYILVIISASILLYRRGSLYVASMSSISYGLLVDLLYYQIFPIYDLQPGDVMPVTARLVYYNIFIHMFAFYSTAFMSSYLSERLRTTRTELQEMDEDLSDLKLLHQKVIDSMTAGLIIATLDGEIEFINESGTRIFGLPNHRIVGRNLRRFFAEEINLDSVRAQLESQKYAPFEKKFETDEKQVLIGMNFSFLHSQKGTPSGLILIFQDITESRRMERQFRLHERMAAIGSMAAGIAHEIRNPLASIHGSVQLLRNELELSDDQQKLMEIVLTESIRLDQTIKNFLNFAKPKQLEKEPHDLKLLMDDMLNFIQKSPEFKAGHNIVFSTSLEGFIHDFDQNQIKQLIWNLSINALHAMPSGGILKVILEHDLQGNVLMKFRDEGRGIDPKRIDSIFDPYQTSTTGGSGLGMAIVYRIVQDHRGQIAIDSQPGSGTTITVQLPVARTHAIQPLLQ